MFPVRHFTELASSKGRLDRLAAGQALAQEFAVVFRQMQHVEAPGAGVVIAAFCGEGIAGETGFQGVDGVAGVDDLFFYQSRDSPLHVLVVGDDISSL